MFEHLLELFFHAKAGAIAGVLILGTAGALVTATVSSSANGSTTITLTQAGTSPSATTLTVTSPAEPQAVSASESVSTSLISAPQMSQESGTTPTTCDPTQAAAANDAVKTVNSAYSQYHTDLAQLRKDNKSDAARTLLEDADKLLKEIRKNAVKAIHATLPCDNENDVNEQNGDKDADKNADDKSGNDKNVTNADDKSGNDKSDPDEQGDNKGEHQSGTDDTTSSTATPPTTTVVTPPTGDVKKIADDAVAAMKLVFDTAKSQLPTTTAVTPGQSRTVNSDSKGNKKDGKHGDRG